MLLKNFRGPVLEGLPMKARLIRASFDKRRIAFKGRSFIVQVPTNLRDSRFDSNSLG